MKFYYFLPLVASTFVSKTKIYENINEIRRAVTPEIFDSNFGTEPNDLPCRTWIGNTYDDLDTYSLQDVLIQLNICLTPIYDQYWLFQQKCESTCGFAYCSRIYKKSWQVYSVFSENPKFPECAAKKQGDKKVFSLCECENGEAKESDQCPNGNFCETCDRGYHLELDQCLPNLCTCEHGLPAPACMIHGGKECQPGSCHPYYSFNPETKLCERSTCTCKNGTPEEWCPTAGEERCSECDHGYMLIDHVCKLNDVAEKELKENCAQSKIDLYIMIDGSTSVGEEDFHTGVNFISHTIDYMNVKPGFTSISLFQYSTDFHNFIENSSDKTLVAGGVQNLYDDYKRGDTYTGKALYQIHEISQKIGRDKVPQVLFLITDGGSTDRLDVWKPETGTIHTPDLLANRGFVRFSIGVGKYDFQELQDIASKPTSDYVYGLNTFDQLDKLLFEISNSICKAGDFKNMNAINQLSN